MAVVPLADVLGDLDAGAAVETGRLGLDAPLLPRQRVVDAEVEKLEGPLRSLAGRYVAVFGGVSEGRTVCDDTLVELAGCRIRDYF